MLSHFMRMLFCDLNLQRRVLNTGSNAVNEIIITAELDFIINLSHVSQKHMHARIQMHSLFDKSVLRKEGMVVYHQLYRNCKTSWRTVASFKKKMQLLLLEGRNYGLFALQDLGAYIPYWLVTEVPDSCWKNAYMTNRYWVSVSKDAPRGS